MVASKARPASSFSSASFRDDGARLGHFMYLHLSPSASSCPRRMGPPPLVSSKGVGWSCPLVEALLHARSVSWLYQCAGPVELECPLHCRGEEVLVPRPVRMHELRPSEAALRSGCSQWLSRHSIPVRVPARLTCTACSCPRFNQVRRERQREE